MRIIRIAMLAAGLLAATGSLQAQTSPSTTPNKANSPSGTATRGVEGSTGTQSGPDPAGAKNTQGAKAQGRQPQSATDPAAGHDVDRSSATKGIPAGQGAQGGAQPDKAKEKAKAAK
jgi:hypothetical protein